MESLADRLRAVMDERNLSQAEVADRATKAGGVKVTQQNIQQILSGRNKTSRHSPAIAKGLDISLDWLATGDQGRHRSVTRRMPEQQEESAVRSPEFAADISALPKDLPVLGGAQAGKDGLFELNGEVLDYVRRPPKLLGVKGGYGLHIRGDCMSPWKEDGDLVIVHPGLPVRPNDYVVIQLLAGSEGDVQNPAYIKRLVRRTASETIVRQYNPKKELTFPAKRIISVHKVLSLEEMMSF